MSKKRKIIVMGVGPSGSAAAMALAASGHVECWLLERKLLPRIKACGSGVSPWTLGFLDERGVGHEVRRRAFRIDGATIAGVKREGVQLRGDHETAVLPRSEFDLLLAREAERRGARLYEGVTVRRLERHRGQTMLETTRGPMEADAVIDCTGAAGGFDRERLLMSALKGPLLDAALAFGSTGPTRQVLKKAFSGLYHG